MVGVVATALLCSSGRGKTREYDGSFSSYVPLFELRNATILRVGHAFRLLRFEISGEPGL